MQPPLDGDPHARTAACSSYSENRAGYISSYIAVRAAGPGSLIGGNAVADTVCRGPADINRSSVTSYIPEDRSKNDHRNIVVSLTTDDGCGSKLTNSKEKKS